jgi:hypothetical protein
VGDLIGGLLDVDFRWDERGRFRSVWLFDPVDEVLEADS